MRVTKVMHVVDVSRGPDCGSDMLLKYRSSDQAPDTLVHMPEMRFYACVVLDPGLVPDTPSFPMNPHDWHKSTIRINVETGHNGSILAGMTMFIKYPGRTVHVAIASVESITTQDGRTKVDPSAFASKPSIISALFPSMKKNIGEVADKVTELIRNKPKGSFVVFDMNMQKQIFGKIQGKSIHAAAQVEKQSGQSRVFGVRKGDVIEIVLAHPVLTRTDDGSSTFDCKGLEGRP
jgi:hypothetical protein